MTHDAKGAPTDSRSLRDIYQEMRAAEREYRGWLSAMPEDEDLIDRAEERYYDLVDEWLTALGRHNRGVPNG